MLKVKMFFGDPAAVQKEMAEWFAKKGYAEIRFVTQSTSGMSEAHISQPASIVITVIYS